MKLKTMDFLSVFAILLSVTGVALVALHVLLPGVALAVCGLICAVIGYRLKYSRDMNVALSYWALVTAIILLVVCALGAGGLTVWDLYSAADVG